MHRPSRVAQCHRAPSNLPIHYTEPEIETAPFFPRSITPLAKAVPDRCNDLFNEVEHSDVNCPGRDVKIGNSPVSQKNRPGDARLVEVGNKVRRLSVARTLESQHTPGP